MDNPSKIPNLIKVNSYIVIQRLGYFKLHQLSNKPEIMLGKDKIDLSNVINKPFWTMFKMIPTRGSKRQFTLEICTQTEDISEDIKDFSSGVDNRNITDDGSSQALTSDDINEMRESGLPAQTILGKIVENSKTFKEKTEFSQEKYLKKKEKKYCEYIVIREPTVRLLSDIFYSRDQLKVLGLRHDALSKIYTYANIQHNGVYALFENGTRGLVGAGLLNYLSDDGLLINLSIGSQSQKQAILAMNFSMEKMLQFVSVKIKDIINYNQVESEPTESKDVVNYPQIKSEQIETKDTANYTEIKIEHTESKDTTNYPEIKIEHTESKEIIINSQTKSCLVESKATVDKCSYDNDTFRKKEIDMKPTLIKRKHSDDDIEYVKKPRWTEDLEKAVSVLKERKLNGIIIVAKEYPLNILQKLLPYLKASSQLVVYSYYREPLIELFLELKKRRDVIGLHVMENWLRFYQVLPERTHPDVNMNCTGYLLTGIKVENS